MYADISWILETEHFSYICQPYSACIDVSAYRNDLCLGYTTKNMDTIILGKSEVVLRVYIKQWKLKYLDV